MSNFLIDDYSSETSFEVRRPPVVLLGCMAAIVAAAIVMFAFDSRMGYGLCVASAVVGAWVSNRDQKARSDPNYLNLCWFRPLKIFLSYSTTLLACAHIAIVAIESAR